MADSSGTLSPRNLPAAQQSCTGEQTNDQELKLSQWRYIVQNFTPAWFSVNMGTGIVSILLNTLPYNGIWLYWISIIIFALNVLLFMIFFTLTLIRYVLWPDIFLVMVTHPSQSLFLGTLPMGFATIINMFCFVCVPVWGEWAKYAVWAMWIVDAILSILACFGIPFIMMTRKPEVSLSSMGAAWLLPIVACVVAAASGGIVAEVLPSSYVLWGIGVPLASMVTVIYLQRLMLHKLPPKAIIVSTFLPLGPLGQGSFGIQKLGIVAREVFPQTATLHHGTGGVLDDVGFLLGLIMWAFGLLWLEKVSVQPFNLGWWAFTFPLGVYSTCTVQLGRDLQSRFFAVLGTIFSLCVVLLWIVVGGLTLRGIHNKALFVAPCLKDLHEKRQRDAEAGRIES
ncbi:hypothetical protein BDW75DRAFT_235321 [Aspergillus navahoensis]